MALHNSRESSSRYSLGFLPPLECFLLCLESCGTQAVTSPWDCGLCLPHPLEVRRA